MPGGGGVDETNTSLSQAIRSHGSTAIPIPPLVMCAVNMCSSVRLYTAVFRIINKINHFVRVPTTTRPLSSVRVVIPGTSIPIACKGVRQCTDSPEYVIPHSAETIWRCMSSQQSPTTHFGCARKKGGGEGTHKTVRRAWAR